MNLTKNNFIVLTGGPGGGKSSIIAELSKRGYHTMDETGRAVIKERLSKGLSPRPDPKEFGHLMFQRDVDNYNANLGRTNLVFFDRSFVDSAWFINQTDKIYFQEVNKIISIQRFNTNVFITPPWKEIYQNDDERDQTFEEAIATYDRLYAWYESNGYHLIVLPKTSVELRAEFILDQLR